MQKLVITLRAARVNNGLTLKDVAKATGKAADTINKYERDSSSIPRDLLCRLLQLYGVDGDVIFYGRESDFIGKKNKSA
ncbi:MAG: helix-turn-helix transcriptional regulator [Thermodesulfobacteriota bacterium]|nr:helix-turn-helix transcriptional regulator [Thermodesulfobacteriota bacterium]